MLEAVSDVSLGSASLANQLGLKLRALSGTAQTTNAVKTCHKRECKLHFQGFGDHCTKSTLHNSISDQLSRQKPWDLSSNIPSNAAAQLHVHIRTFPVLDDERIKLVIGKDANSACLTSEIHRGSLENHLVII